RGKAKEASHGIVSVVVLQQDQIATAAMPVLQYRTVSIRIGIGPPGNHESIDSGQGTGGDASEIDGIDRGLHDAGGTKIVEVFCTTSKSEELRTIPCPV